MKKEPLSLEELMAKKKAEEEARSKVSKIIDDDKLHFGLQFTEV